MSACAHGSGHAAQWFQQVLAINPNDAHTLSQLAPCWALDPARPSLWHRTLATTMPVLLFVAIVVLNLPVSAELLLFQTAAFSGIAISWMRMLGVWAR